MGLFDIPDNLLWGFGALLTVGCYIQSVEENSSQLGSCLDCLLLVVVYGEEGFFKSFIEFSCWILNTPFWLVIHFLIIAKNTTIASTVSYKQIYSSCHTSSSLLCWPGLLPNWTDTIPTIPYQLCISCFKPGACLIFFLVLVLSCDEEPRMKYSS